MVSGLVLCGQLGAAGAQSLEPDTLPVPPAPAAATSERLALPAVASFALPIVEGGVHDVRELRVRGHGLLGAQLAVKGYVTWIYDCLVALAKPGVPPAETKLLIDDNPQLCERPKFYLGASPRTAPETALWVVDVPRAANKREQIALNEVQLGMRPPVPRLAIGDLVVVTGTFALQSPHGEHSSDGLLVYQKLAHLPPSARVAPLEPDATDDRRALPPTTSDAPALRAVVPVRVRNQSIDDYERCNAELEHKQLDAALASCRAAVAQWTGNHLAWYALGNALAAREDWRGAGDAYDRAAELRPDAAMYQLYAGIAAYQLAQRQVADGHGPTSASAATFDRAWQALASAEQRAPNMWLAPYYLGNVERALDHARAAAASFTRSIQADPTQGAPYVGLLQLYRAWDKDAAALAVAQVVQGHVTQSPPALWFELGMTFEATRHPDDALAAFTRAIAAGGGAQARFQRGQLYARRGDLAHARPDLEAVLAARDPALTVAKQIAQSLIASAEREQRADRAYLSMPKHYQGE